MVFKQKSERASLSCNAQSEESSEPQILSQGGVLPLKKDSEERGEGKESED
jgi:hypothetical protein